MTTSNVPTAQQQHTQHDRRSRTRFCGAAFTLLGLAACSAAPDAAPSAPAEPAGSSDAALTAADTSARKADALTADTAAKRPDYIPIGIPIHEPCGSLGWGCCANSQCYGSNETCSSNGCACDPGYVPGGAGCVLDQTYYSVRLVGSFFETGFAAPLDQLSIAINNGTLSLNVPPSLPFSAPPPSNVSLPSGGANGVNYNISIPNLSIDNWQWSDSSSLVLTANLHGQIDVNLNYNGWFGCTATAQIAGSQNVRIVFDIVNGSTTVQSATVNLGNISYPGYCTWASVAGYGNISNQLTSGIEQALTTNFDNVFGDSALMTWSNVMTEMANGGILQCQPGATCPSGGFVGDLPPASSGWAWSCLAVNSLWNPGSIDGTCQRR